MRYLRTCALFAAMLVGGCSTLAQPSATGHRQGAESPQGTESPQGAESPQAAESPQRTESQPGADSPQGTESPGPENLRLPSNALSSSLLYRLLSADIAAQRGNLQLAATTYLKAARDTHDPRLAKRAARLAFLAHNPSQALEAADLWVKLDPDDMDGRRTCATLLLREGRAEDAVVHLESILDHSAADSGEGYQAVVNLLGQDPDKTQALKLFDRVVGKRARVPEAQLARAQLAFLVGRTDEAMTGVDALLKARPTWAKALVLKATMQRHMGKATEALATYKAAVNAAPKDTGLRLSYARLLVDEQRYEEANAQFDTLHRQVPDNADITFALGLLSMQVGDSARAERAFHEVIDSGQRTDEAAYALGQLAETHKDYKEALRWYGAVSDGGEYVNAKARSAAVIMRTQGLDAARKYLQSLRGEMPEEQVRFYLMEGELLRNAKRYQDAMALYDEALKALPKDPELLYARAMVAERLNRLDWLERDLRAILAADPNNAQALNALGYTLADRTDRYKEAYEYIRRALAQDPEDPATNDSMGWVLFRLGRYPEAETYLKKAAEHMKDPEVAAHLGELYWVTGRKNDAHRVWNEGLKEDPDNAILKTVIQRLDK